MQPVNLVSSSESDDLNDLSHLSIIEKARVEALEQLLSGASDEQCVFKITRSLESVLNSCHLDLMLVNKQHTQLKAFRAAKRIFLPYVSTLEALQITQCSFGSHAAAFSKALVICENISLDPAWSSVHQQAEELGLAACWSMPLMAENEQTMAVLSVYFSEPKTASQDERLILAQAANTILLILRHRKHMNLVQQNATDDSHAIAEAKVLLVKALEQRSEVQNQLIEMENMASLGAMMSSLTHEINTPIAVAITAAGYLASVQQQSQQKMLNDELKKPDLGLFCQECQECQKASQIIERNLICADHLIKSFKQMSIDQHSQELRTFSLCEYVFEVMLSLKPKLERTPHKFCIDIAPDLQIVSNPGAISQLLINLITNSVQHAFDEGCIGRIHISAKISTNPSGLKILHLEYRDNGKGMSHSTIENIYKPFFTLARDSVGSGLGLHICNNIVMKGLKGSIDCHSDLGEGVNFVIRFPLQKM